ncbi:MAG: MazG nucleotide pyrophosphohydrolase domain-containing protein [Pseudomonadales bacterium]
MGKTFSELCEIQRDFDKSHSVSGKSFYVDIDDKNLQELEHLIVCLVGELGEFSNILKKVVRGDSKLSDVKSELDEELADTFIYLLKISNQFGVNLEKELLKKISKNQRRFEES